MFEGTKASVSSAEGGSTSPADGAGRADYDSIGAAARAIDARIPFHGIAGVSSSVYCSANLTFFISSRYNINRALF